MKKFIFILLWLPSLVSCQKEETKMYKQVIPTSFSINGNYTINLPDFPPTAVKVKIQMDKVDTSKFKISFKYIGAIDDTFNLPQSQSEDLIRFVHKKGKQLNCLEGYVSEPISGSINLIYKY
jgi:hypothetical protein